MILLQPADFRSNYRFCMPERTKTYYTVHLIIFLWQCLFLPRFKGPAITRLPSRYPFLTPGSLQSTHTLVELGGPSQPHLLMNNLSITCCSWYWPELDRTLYNTLQFSCTIPCYRLTQKNSLSEHAQWMLHFSEFFDNINDRQTCLSHQGMKYRTGG